MSLLKWFGKKKDPETDFHARIAGDDLYVHPCPDCGHQNNEEEVLKNFYVCSSCGHHFRVPPRVRINLLTDPGSFKEFDEPLGSLNPLDLQDYPAKLRESRKKTNLQDALITGVGSIDNYKTVLVVMSFQFMGGSMGSVVGEKITRSLLVGAEKGLPVIIFTASGGARMQEGIFSLMQMAKTSGAAALLEESHEPLFIVLTHPTTGGVTASFAMLGDVILAEPGALIGFAGPRVIEGTIKQKLPEGFQRAEFQKEKGFVDEVVHRKELRNKLSFLLKTHELNRD